MTHQRRVSQKIGEFYKWIRTPWRSLGRSWITLNIHEHIWIILNTLKYSWILLNLPKYSWILLNTPEYSWILLNTPLYSWIPLDGALISMRPPWHLLLLAITHLSQSCKNMKLPKFDLQKIVESKFQGIFHLSICKTNYPFASASQEDVRRDSSYCPGHGHEHHPGPWTEGQIGGKKKACCGLTVVNRILNQNNWVWPWLAPPSPLYDLQ